MCCGGLVVGRQGCLGRAQPTSGHPLVEMQRCDHTVRHLAILDHRRQAGAQHAPEDVLWPIAPAAGIPDREEKLVLLDARLRSEEHTSELQSLMRTSYAFFCLKKKKKNISSVKQIN